MMTSRRLLSIHAAARRLGINSDDLRQLVKAQALPVVVLPGDRLRFDPSDLAEFIAARKRPAAAEPLTL